MTVVLNLFHTRDGFCGRQFFHGRSGRVRGNGAGHRLASTSDRQALGFTESAQPDPSHALRRFAVRLLLLRGSDAAADPTGGGGAWAVMQAMGRGCGCRWGFRRWPPAVPSGSWQAADCGPMRQQKLRVSVFFLVKSPRRKKCWRMSDSHQCIVFS